MYKKVSLLILISCYLIIGCSAPIENNSRLAFDLKVVDDANQPISNVDVSASVYRRVSSIIFVPVIPSFEGVVGVGTTNNQGELNLISLEPSESIDQIGILINSNEQFAGSPINEDYGVVIYQLDSVLTRTTVLPETLLKRSATLEIEIIDSLAIEGVLTYTITYPTRIQQFQFPSGEESISQTIEGGGLPDPTGIITLETLQNTTALFTYSLTLDSGMVETNTIEIPINQETVQYVFEF